MDADINIALIGAGGIGSWFGAILARMIKHRQFKAAESPPDNYYDQLNVNVTVFDPDIIERDNLRHQLFFENEIGMYKAMVIGLRGKFSYKLRRFDIKTDCADYNVFIVAADNAAIRYDVFDYVKMASNVRQDLKLIDMRCSGTAMTVFTQLCDYDLFMSMLPADKEDTRGHSCQREEDTAVDKIQLGNMTIAPIGMQILLNMFRGIDVPDHLVSSNIPMSMGA